MENTLFFYEDIEVILKQGDCLEKMKDIPDGSVDLVLCDPPYGRSKCHWDTVIPFKPLWEHYKRIIKENGAIILFAQMPFGADLIQSNKKMYRYEWIWEKVVPTGFLNANRMPLRKHENILVFYKKLPTYNPQMTQGKPYKGITKPTMIYGDYKPNITNNQTGNRYPTDVITFAQDIIYNNSKDVSKKCIHPTQKPVPLLEYFIKTYTNPGELVLDNCMGSGSTGVAAINTGRNFIGIEKDEKIFKTAKGRIEKHIKQLNQEGGEENGNE